MKVAFNENSKIILTHSYSVCLLSGVVFIIIMKIIINTQRYIIRNLNFWDPILDNVSCCMHHPNTSVLFKEPGHTRETSKAAANDALTTNAADPQLPSHGLIVDEAKPATSVQAYDHPLVFSHIALHVARIHNLKLRMQNLKLFKKRRLTILSHSAGFRSCKSLKGGMRAFSCS